VPNDFLSINFADVALASAYIVGAKVKTAGRVLSARGPEAVARGAAVSAGSISMAALDTGAAV
jgi:hypothetical protein